MSGRYRVDLDFSGKVAVVTGAGQGIGRAIALTFASHRAAVVVSDLDKERADAVVRDIVAAGGTALSVKADVTRTDDIASLMSGALSLGDTIDILIHNAAYFPLIPFEEITPSILDRTLDVNLKAAFWLTRARSPQACSFSLRERHRISRGRPSSSTGERCFPRSKTISHGENLRKSEKTAKQ